MSIVPNVGPFADIHGFVSVGTVTGITICAEHYDAAGGEPVAQRMAHALDALWSSLPGALAQHGDGRFDFLIRQVAEGHAPADLYWSSGMTGPVLLTTVARKLHNVRQACHATARVQHPAPRPALEVTELREVPLPLPSQTDRVQDTLRRLLHGGQLRA